MAAPIRDLTDTQRAELREALAKAEHLAREHARILEGCRAILAEPPVDMLADPLAPFRLPSGAVSYEVTYAGEVAVGDWVQRCFGDPDWHLVTEVEELPWFHKQTHVTFLRVTYDGLARDWARNDALRIARRPEHVVADQERKTGAA